MKELTDEMIQKSLNTFNSVWFVVLGILLFFTLIFICLIIRFKIESNNNVKGLIITTIIFAFLEIGCVFMIKDSKENSDNWRVEIAEITSIDHHTEFENESDVSYEVYEVTVGDYSRKIRISEDLYNRLRKGDKVYVLVSGNALAIDIWDTKEYKYVGEKLK